MPVDFRFKLREQLDLIEGSAGLFDKGLRAAALQIATSIRTIAHDGNRSAVSLLTHLQVRSTIKMLSTGSMRPVSFNMTPNLPPGMTPISGFSQGILQRSPTTTSHLAVPGPLREFVPFGIWWAQVVHILPGGVEITRMSLVRSATDKDGGAHVDAKLDAGYKQFKEDPFPTLDLKGADESLRSVAYNVLRNIGGEVLNSPEIQDLAAKPDRPSRAGTEDVAG